jgi:aminoglycoside 3-N-acetyltransferase
MKSIYENRPQTKTSLIHDLLAIGVRTGSILMVHSSLSSIGWVLGGAPTVVEAMLEVLGDKGTLAMPAASPYCADPGSWGGPTIPDKWLDEVREHLPVFKPNTTPTSMGAIAECFRTWPATLRSNHPLTSVSANGPLSKDIVSEHALEFSEGNKTPFEKLSDLDSWILLIGVGFNRCTALHFAEAQVDNRRVTKNRFPVLKDGKRVWVEVSDMADDNNTHFPIVGDQFIKSGRALLGLIGCAESILFPMRELVNFASEYFQNEL